jgi:transcriptional regulator with XRE-family HTH domain
MARRRREGKAAHYRELARFLGVEPITLRRWLSGERPIPRTVEVVMEMYDAYPEEMAGLTAAANRGREAT